jgi:hypothetical protein
MTDEIKGILERVRQGTTTAEDAESLEVLVTVYQKRVQLLEAANRCYAERIEMLEKGEGL